MRHLELENLKQELLVKAKSKKEIILTLGVIWLIICCVLTLEITDYGKSVLAFAASGLLLSGVFLFSKFFKAQRKLSEHPLKPLRLWLNFAQLFYFPFLVLILIKSPEYFVITYAILTAMHLFPFTRLNKKKNHAFMASISSMVVLIIGLYISNNTMFYIPLFASIALLVLVSSIYIPFRKK